MLREDMKHLRKEIHEVVLAGVLPNHPAHLSRANLPASNSNANIPTPRGVKVLKSHNGDATPFTPHGTLNGGAAPSTSFLGDFLGMETSSPNVEIPQAGLKGSNGNLFSGAGSQSLELANICGTEKHQWSSSENSSEAWRY